MVNKLVMLSCVLLLSCDTVFVPFCETPDIVGSWDADYYEVTVSFGPEKDTLEEISMQYQITFLENHEGYYDSTQREFNWYLQCSPGALLISEKIGSTGDFFSTSYHHMNYISMDSMYSHKDYLDIGYTQVFFILTRR